MSQLLLAGFILALFGYVGYLLLFGRSNRN